MELLIGDHLETLLVTAIGGLCSVIAWLYYRIQALGEARLADLEQHTGTLLMRTKEAADAARQLERIGDAIMHIKDQMVSMDAGTLRRIDSHLDRIDARLDAIAHQHGTR